jgi:tripartite-type tricarboxylate transporter receptor subunit TctC
MRRFAITLLAWLCIAPAAAQTAATWPSKPVRLIVPYAPGGGIDFVARVLAQKLTEQPGGTFIVDNRPGAGGIVAAELVARAAPDLVRRIHAEATRALGTPETIEKIAQGGGSDYVGTTPEEFSAFVRSEISKWTKLVKASNIRVE